MPAEGDLLFCPFLSLTDTNDYVPSNAESNPCIDTSENGYGIYGWIEYDIEGASSCGMVYDCCTTTYPVGCWKELCMMWNETTGWCGIPIIAPPKKQKLSKAAILINEYLGNEDLDDNGKVYGRDFHITGGFEREKVFSGYDGDGNEMYLYRDPETGVMHDSPGGKESSKPPALKGIPNKGGGMSWGAYLKSVE